MNNLTYYPPQDKGVPSGALKAHAIVWCLSQGYDSRTIRKLTGCSSGYVARVKRRYRLKGEEHVLKILDSVSRYWGITE